MDDSALLMTHMEDLARRAAKTVAAHSKFLSAREAAEVERHFGGRGDVRLCMEGGFDSAERRVAVFTQPDWGSCDLEDVLAGLAVRHRVQDVLRHQDVLGAVLGLGLSRDVLGDILIEPGCASTVCLASMADYIARELCKVGRVGVEVVRLPLAELPSLAVELEEKQATVASLRLDAVLAAAFTLSRTAACEVIRAGRVQLAHQECVNTSQPVQAGDILSVRGKGRVKLVAVEGFSRKGKQRIVLGFFG